MDITPDTILDNVVDIYHPSYKQNSIFWLKWRLTYRSGDYFINRYLERFSDREEFKDFEFRRLMTYVPAYAKAAVNDIKNAIFQRTADTTREGGPLSYQNAIAGLNGGVDLNGSSMSFFMGQKILPELLSMGKVGVFIDMPQIHGQTIADKGSKRPYLYFYPIEDIQAWSYEEEHEDPNEFDALILKDHTFVRNDEGLPIGEEVLYRHVWIYQNRVYTRFYNDEGSPISDAPIELNIDRVPFVVLELSDSLLSDVSNHQIALMNLASSDMFYALLANYPFYTEQFDARNENPYINTTIVSEEKPKDSNTINVGPTKGRRYPINTDRPQFIAPPSEPLKVSMEKQKQLKEEIYNLVNLSVANIIPTIQSTRNPDTQGLEAGLSYIGLVLENAERKIGSYWAKYEGANPPTVEYPDTYTLPNADNIIKENEQDLALADKITSTTFKKTILKRIAKRTVGNHVSAAVLRTIESEIDRSPVILGDVNSINLDIQNGLVSNKTASIARGYPDDESDLAKIDHAERLALIQSAQTPPGESNILHPTGVTDLTVDPKSGRKQKDAAESTLKDPIPTDKTRGNGQMNDGKQ